MWIKCACGDAVNLNYVKKIFIEVKGFGAGQKFFVNAVVDGGAKSDDWCIVDVFDKRDDAKNLISQLIGDDFIG